MKTAMTIILLALTAGLFAKGGTMPGKNKKVYITSTDPKAAAMGSDEMKSFTYWQPVSSRDNADYIINYKVKKSPVISFLSYNMTGSAEIIDAKSGNVIYTTKNANTFGHMFGANHRKQLIKKLTRRIEKDAVRSQRGAKQM